MKKQLRMLIISGFVLIALLAVWLVSTLLPGETTETTTATTVAALYEAKAEDISQIAVSNANGSFTLLPVESKGSDGKTTTTWKLDGADSFKTDTTAIDSVVKVATALSPDKEIVTGAADLATYGLDKPQATLTVTLKTGDKHVIKLGSKLASGSSVYAMLDNSGRVCAVSTDNNEKAQYTMLDLLDKSAIIGIETTDLTQMTFERARDNFKLVTTSKLVGATDTSTGSLEFQIIAPISKEGNATALSTLAGEATGISVNKYVELNPKDLAQYGLDQPRYTFILQTKDKTVTLKIGKQMDSDNYYAMSDVLPAVFSVASSAFTSVDTSALDLMDRFVCLESIWNVSKIEGNLMGTKFTAEINMLKNQKASDEAVTYKLDGVNAKIFNQSDASLFGIFYQKLIGPQVAGLDLEAKPTNTRNASLTFYIKADTENNSAAQTKVIEFARRDDYTYYVFADGAYTGYYVDGEKTFTSDESGDEGIVIAYKQLKYAIAHAVNNVFNTEEGYQLD